MMRGEPPRRSITLSRRCAKKPSRRPSGDQNGKRASIVPGNSFASVDARGRTQSDVRPSLPRATKASCRPSDESARPLTMVVALGAATANSACSAAPSFASAGRAGLRKSRAPRPSPPSTAPVASAHGHQRDRRVGFTSAAGDAASSSPPPSTSSSTMRASAMSCRRFFGLRSRQRRSKRRIAGGVASGSLPRSISVLQHAGQGVAHRVGGEERRRR